MLQAVSTDLHSGGLFHGQCQVASSRVSGSCLFS